MYLYYYVFSYSLNFSVGGMYTYYKCIIVNSEKKTQNNSDLTLNV